MTIETGKLDALQVVYNILHQDLQETLFPIAEKEQIGVIASVPLERGVLSGQIFRCIKRSASIRHLHHRLLRQKPRSLRFVAR